MYTQYYSDYSSPTITRYELITQEMAAVQAMTKQLNTYSIAHSSVYSSVFTTSLHPYIYYEVSAYLVSNPELK